MTTVLDTLIAAFICTFLCFVVFSIRSCNEAEFKHKEALVEKGYSECFYSLNKVWCKEKCGE